MIDFDLPHSTVIKKVIPKNAFDNNTNSKEKSILAKSILRMTWENSISSETTNLSSIKIDEIQIIHIQLKELLDITTILNIIDKNIPYHIIFIISYNDTIKLHTTNKRASSLDETQFVLDWTFCTSWNHISEKFNCLNLSKNIDHVYYKFCSQFSDFLEDRHTSLDELIVLEKRKKLLSTELLKHQRELSRQNQFNKKVEIQLKIAELETQINTLICPKK